MDQNEFLIQQVTSQKFWIKMDQKFGIEMDQNFGIKMDQNTKLVSVSKTIKAFIK